jgi:hypothetical protein
MFLQSSPYRNYVAGTAGFHRQTGMYRRIYRTTIVTLKFVGLLVKCEGYIAILTLRYPPATLAYLVGGITPAVLK